MIGDEKPNYVLYILMRTDLQSMNPGKAMAQASHASNAFLHQAEIDRGESKEVDNAVVDWISSTPQGFGTVLVLGCTIMDILRCEEHVHLNFEKVIDPTYPYIVNKEVCDLIDSSRHTMAPHELESGDMVCFREEVTCAYLFGDKNNPVTTEYIKHLKLHP